jgi:transposase InsO family protein
MSMARVVITAVVLEGRTKSEVARDYGVSRRWVQKLVARYRLEGEAAFEAHSRRPHTNPNRIAGEVEDAIVALRKQLSEAGHDAGAETIAWHLRQQSGGSAPSVATIWRVLSRRGFVIPQPHKRPRSSWHRFAAELPNELWQADITHWLLADGVEVEILDIIDDHSRLLVGATARAVFKAGTVVADLHTAIAHHGRPERLLTDNGAVFTGHHRGGWVALERETAALGIALIHSKPYHPTTCGKVERVHQTLKNWLTRQPTANTLAALQAQLDTFTDYYNTARPHRGIDRQTPAAAWAARPRAIPTRQGIQISDHFRVRKDRVDRDGKLTLRHNSRLHHIGIGHDRAGTRVLMLIRELNIRIITEDSGELIRELTLDPSRDYQPTGRDRYARWRP